MECEEMISKMKSRYTGKVSKTKEESWREFWDFFNKENTLKNPLAFGSEELKDILKALRDDLYFKQDSACKVNMGLDVKFEEARKKLINKISFEIEYPEDLECDDIDGFRRFRQFDGKPSYKEDYEEAKKFAEEIGGVVYTMVDGDDNEVYYIKGLHYVNRLAFCVLKK